MANAFVDTGAQAFANGSINWASDTIKAFLADASFTPTYDAAGNINNAQFLSTVSSSMVGTAVTLAGKTSVAGVLSSNNLSFLAVAGNTIVRMWIYKDTGNPATSQLILAYDTGNTAGNFPIDPIGGTITVAWDTGVTSGIAGIAQI